MLYLMLKTNKQKLWNDTEICRFSINIDYYKYSDSLEKKNNISPEKASHFMTKLNQISGISIELKLI